MVIADVEVFWDRYGDKTKKNKINEMIAAINTNSLGSRSMIIPMHIEPAAGATWGTSNGLSVLLDAGGELLVGNGGLGANIKRYRVHIWYRNDSNKNLSVFLGEQEEDSALSWNRLSGSSTSFPDVNNNMGKITLGWYTINENPVEVRLYMSSGDTTTLNIFSIDIEVNTESA